MFVLHLLERRVINLLATKQPLVFIDEKKGESKSGRPYQFIKLADPQTFENYEVFGEGVVVSGISKGSKVNVEFALNSNYGRTGISVVDMQPVKL